MEKEWETFRGLQRWRDTDGVRRGFLPLDLTGMGGRASLHESKELISFVTSCFTFISSKGMKIARYCNDILLHFHSFCLDCSRGDVINRRCRL